MKILCLRIQYLVYFISTVQGKFEAFRYEMIKDLKATFDTSDTRKQNRLRHYLEY